LWSVVVDQAVLGCIFGILFLEVLFLFFSFFFLSQNAVNFKKVSMKPKEQV